MSLAARFVALLGIWMFASAAQADAPFGVPMASDPLIIPTCQPSESGRTGFFKCTSLPTKHPAFEFYGLMAPRETGVCRISGVGIDIPDSGYGTSTQSKVREVAEQLAQTYGPPTKIIDYVAPRALSHDPSEWLMDVAKKERIYGILWEEGRLPVKNGVEDIFVAADASGRETGFIRLEINFTNSPQCIAAVKRAEGA